MAFCVHLPECVHPLPECIHLPKCVHPLPECIHLPTFDDAKRLACRSSPDYQLGLVALKVAKDRGIVTKDTWQGMVDFTVYSLAEVSILAAIIARGCGDCLTEDAFG